MTGIPLVILLFAAAYLIHYKDGVAGERQAICLRNMHLAGLALQMYAADHAGFLPPAAGWCDSLDEYDGPMRELSCPALPAGEVGGYALNDGLNGRLSKRYEGNLVMCFETASGWNAYGGREALLRKPRHSRGNVFLFEDAHVEQHSSPLPCSIVWKAPSTRDD